MSQRPGVDDVFGPDGITAVFHPIVECRRAASVHGYEALMRGPKGLPFEGPLLAFALAKSLEMLERFDLRCMQAALAAGPEQRLFVNLHPSTLVSVGADEVAALASGLGRNPASMVLEIIEHEAGRESELARAVADLRDHGFAIAVDDFGEGASNLRRLLRLRPDYLKVDRWFVDGCAGDRERRAVVRAVASLGADLGIRVIAEGVRTAADLEAVCESGIGLVQGRSLAALLGNVAAELGHARRDAHPGADPAVVEPVLQHVDHLDERRLDTLPFGVIELAPDGTVLQYNRYEENLAGRDARDVVGRNFFTEVAPCTDVQEFAGRFRTGVASRNLHSTFDFTFAFVPPRQVRVTLYFSEATGTAWVFVQEP